MPSSKIRLDKLVSGLGYCSRREVRSLVRSGLISVIGSERVKSDQLVDPALVRVDGAELDPLPGLILMLNKPVGYTCSHNDLPPLVFDLLPPRYSNRSPPLRMVGRLDRETSGLLLITDDGELVHRLTSPRHHVEKSYFVTLRDPLSSKVQETFASGELILEGEDAPLAPAHFTPIDNHSGRLVITEGRYHQIRRMFAAVGNSVETLHRERVGQLSLGDLESGKFRQIDRSEIGIE